AAPFATGSYEAEPYSSREVPLTAEDRAVIIARWSEDFETMDCGQAVRAKVGFNSLARLDTCIKDRLALMNGSRQEDYFSLWKYVVINGVVMLAALMVTFFALTAAMAAVRKWWRWWW